jgi:segregation and condensation protein A
LTVQAETAALPAAWRVHLPEFEGPLDLLLHLVRINKVDLKDIPVATICDQFHETLRLMERLDLDIAAEYVYEAAQLIYLKSRLLLPRQRNAQGEEEDPRQELVERLLEYRRLKEAAQSFAQIHSLRREVWTLPGRPVPEVEGGEGVELGDVSLYDLLGALRTVLVRYDYDHPLPLHLHGERFTVRSQVERLMAALGEGKTIDLLADLRARRSRGEVVAAFLAVLELCRLWIVRLHQTEGGDILVSGTGRSLAAHDLEALES